MGRRSRKRGQRQPPPPPRPQTNRVRPSDPPRPTEQSTATRRPRAAQRDAAVRATLEPLEPGERPWTIKIGALLALLIGGIQLVLFVLGVKLKVAGAQPRAGSTILFGVIMFVCAAGVWAMRYWAVLGLMALLGIMTTYFGLALIRVSSLEGAVIGIVGAGGCGFLFYKLVRILSRIQMPRYPGR